MKKILGFLLIILLFAYAPIQDIWPIDYSSKSAHVLIFLGNLQIFIITNLASLIDILLPALFSLLNIIASLTLQIIQKISSLPYNNLNPWYVLVGLFIIAFFFEKFRVINNELYKLNKKIINQSKLHENIEKIPVSDESDEIIKLNSKADSIMKLLSDLNEAADIFKPKALRSKKIRRDTFSSSDNKEEVSIALLSEKEEVPVISTDEIIDDENISQIDLARALIASNEIEDAKNLLQRIVETGNENHKHEARLLFMQIK